MGFLLWPRKLPKTFTGHGYEVTVNPDRTIVVRTGDWLSKYTLAIWGDCTEEHLRAFLLKRGSSLEGIRHPELIKAGDTLYVDARLPDEPNPAPGPEAPGGGYKLPHTFAGHGFAVTVNADRTILVKPGDWLSKYALAIWGDCTERHIWNFQLKRGASLVTIDNPKLIKAGDTLYVRPYTLPGEFRRPWLRPPIGWGAPLPR